MQRNSFGSFINITLFGESHGPAVGAVIDGLAPGIIIDENFIAFEMEKRRAVGAISTPRQEADRVEFLSGVYEGHTTGTPICLLVHNENTRSADYDQLRNIPRPSHADFTGRMKYRGYADPRGGGHFSGRLTAPLVAAGAIFRGLLAQQGILLGTHLCSCANLEDALFPEDDTSLRTAISALNEKRFATLDDDIGQQMQTTIVAAKNGGDSVGGALETAVVGLPVGLGEPFFASVESELSALLFSIPAVKGVEFGLGFGFAYLNGSQANDAFCLRDGQVRTTTNFNGGVNGGITNGMPLIVRSVVKPTPSISLPQKSVDFVSGSEVTLEMKGRHDPCILHRARAVADAVVAFGLCDLLCQQYGVSWQLKPLETPTGDN